MGRGPRAEGSVDKTPSPSLTAQGREHLTPAGSWSWPCTVVWNGHLPHRGLEPPGQSVRHLALDPQPCPGSIPCHPLSMWHLRAQRARWAVLARRPGVTGVLGKDSPPLLVMAPRAAAMETLPVGFHHFDSARWTLSVLARWRPQPRTESPPQSSFPTARSYS